MDKLQRVRSVQADTSLSDDEKAKRIFEIMHSVPEPARPVEIKCQHYERGCQIIAKCCQKQFPCRLCHDEHSDHKIDRHATEQIVCNTCQTEQPVSNQCIYCAVSFGDYYCEPCRFWVNDQVDNLWHCDKCGICRRKSLPEIKYIHCDQCHSCWPESGHECIAAKDATCPVCNEPIWDSCQTFVTLPCQHVIHTTCFQELIQHDFRCPLCKKSVTNMNWTALADQVRATPVPEEFANWTVDIACDDCGHNVNGLKYHPIGHACPECSSFNTIVKVIHRSGGEE